MLLLRAKPELSHLRLEIATQSCDCIQKKVTKQHVAKVKYRLQCSKDTADAKTDDITLVSVFHPIKEYTAVHCVCVCVELNVLTLITFLESDLHISWQRQEACL